MENGDLIFSSSNDNIDSSICAKLLIRMAQADPHNTTKNSSHSLEEETKKWRDLSQVHPK